MFILADNQLNLLPMISLQQATVYKFKSISFEQTVVIDNGITAFVGMNEAGKTVFLEALAKCRYIDPNNSKFKFDPLFDYPTSEYKEFMQRSSKNNESEPVVKLTYSCKGELKERLKLECGVSGKDDLKFDIIHKWDNSSILNLEFETSLDKVIKLQYEKFGISTATWKKFNSLKTINEIREFFTNLDEEEKEKVEAMLKSFETRNENNSIDSYVFDKYISGEIPSFWYYSDYYELKGKTYLADIAAEESPEEDMSLQTTRALFKFASIDLNSLLNDEESYERFVKELEATRNVVTKNLFKYWKSNKNLRIEFKIESRKRAYTNPSNKHVEYKNEKSLDIRVENLRHNVSLPLEQRSKGFNWFFSFFIWFSYLQLSEHNKVILLLDEPGLSLHGHAQKDLLQFFEDLSGSHQIIYTTHSPFMLMTERLDRARTITDVGDDGTLIQEAGNERNGAALFPLQAALGYDIAQSLFIGEKNLIIEGVSDLIYLTHLSNILKSINRTGLREDVVLVPVGGIDKVSSFLALFGAQNLTLACLLDTPKDSSKAHLDNLVKAKIAEKSSLKYFHEFVDKKRADIEDIFSTTDYLKIFKLYNTKFTESKSFMSNATSTRILEVLEKEMGASFSHFLPANKFASAGTDSTWFEAETLDRFEAIFQLMNLKYDLEDAQKPAETNLRAVRVG
jgi:predicted ATP-dependent endonuclease of OLD family